MTGLYRVFLCSMLTLNSLAVFCQKNAENELIIKSIGTQLVTNYAPTDYNFGGQNFDVLVGDDNKIYFANNLGVLVYDGTNWTTIKLPKNVTAYSLSKSTDGTIYVGAINELGYLSPSPNGNLIFISLKETLKEYKDLGFTCWNTNAINGKIIFTTGTALGIYDETTKEMSVVECIEGYWSMRESHNELYSYQEDSLYILAENKWKGLRPSNLYQLSRERRMALVDINDSQTIVITENGFFDFKTDEKLKISDQLERFLKNSQLFGATLLKSKYIAISTLSGLIITDLNGSIIQTFDKSRGFQSNETIHTILDNSNMLWVGTLSGISKIDIFSPFTVFDKANGIQSEVISIEKHNDNLYLGCFDGIYSEKLENIGAPNNTADFKKLSHNTCWNFISTNDNLIGLTEMNTLILEGDTFTEIPKSDGWLIFWAGYKDIASDDIFLASNSGLFMHLQKKKDNWEVKRLLDPKYNDAKLIAQGAGNDIWISSESQGVSKLTYYKDSISITAERRYGIEQGLPFELDNYVYRIDTAVYVTTKSGIYKYDYHNDNFIKDPNFINSVKNKAVTSITKDSNGNIYFNAEEVYQLKIDNKDTVQHQITNRKLENYPINMFKPIDEKNIFIGSSGTIIHIDPSQSNILTDFEVVISKVSSLNLNDSTTYNGFGYKPSDLSFSYNQNAVRIEFSATYFQNNDKTTYKWRLNNGDWSNWSSEHSKDYTNLSHGNYDFEVVAKNVFGKESSPTLFHFTIITPWFLSWWAYAFYGIFGLASIWLLVNYKTNKLIQEKKELEIIIADRTSEINNKKQKAEKDTAIIASQHEKLLQMDKLKSRFFINISHELRTPLTLTMGPVNEALKGKYGLLNSELQAGLKVSQRNSKRLLTMVNNILDLSKLESGKTQLFVSKNNVAELISQVVDFFSSKMFDKNIAFKADIDSNIELYIDADKVETVFINVIANALKFTSKGGSVSINMTEEKERINFIIKDDGFGIPEEDIPYVFDRFYHSKYTTSGEGTGVGLALSKELVELHKGTITVQSSSEKGTVFTVSFLKGKNHFETIQIVEKPKPVTLNIDIPIGLDEVISIDDDLNNHIEDSRDVPHVLLVEDNHEMRRFIYQLLQDDFRISTAENGQEGLKFLKTNQPDLILTDYLMPMMDGFEMAVEIKKSQSLIHIPIIFLTARTDEEGKINVLNLGVNDYLIKPFSSDELHIRINNLLNISNKREKFLKQTIKESADIEWTELSSKLKVDIDNYIKTHLTEVITGDDLATHTKQSERTLYRKVKANTGLSLMQYIKEYRLRKARTLLENKEVLNVSEAAFAVGFNYLSHFTKNYKERFGKKPSDYFS